MNKLWYRDFFDEVVNDFWQHALPPEHTLAEVDLAWRELGLQPGQQVLDVPCGHGRHAVELARRGCRVIGIDISADNLARAKRAADEAGVSLELKQGDIAELEALPACDAVLTMGNCFGYLDHAGSSRFVKMIGQALRKGGRWILDSGTVAESILPHLQSKLEFSKDGLTMRIHNRYLPLESCLETTYEFVGENGVKTCRNWHFVFTLAEIRRMLHIAGLVVVSTYTNTSNEPFEVGCPNLYLVAGKSELPS